MRMHQIKCVHCGECHEWVNIVPVNGPPQFGKYTHYVLCSNAVKSGILRLYIRRLDNGKWTSK